MKMEIGTKIANRQRFAIDLETAGHGAIVGNTGSGKSNFLQLLAGGALRSNGKILLAGCDASGLIFAPLQESPYRFSLGEPAEKAVSVVEKLVSVMETRLIWLREHQADSLGEPDSTVPRILVIFEELPALRSLLSAADLGEKKPVSERLLTRFSKAVLRLHAEGRKANFSCFSASQVGQKETLEHRNNCLFTCVFRTENVESRMLLPGISADEQEALSVAAPGVCFIRSGSGKNGFVKLDFLSYERYRLCALEAERLRG